MYIHCTTIILRKIELEGAVPRKNLIKSIYKFKDTER